MTRPAPRAVIEGGVVTIVGASIVILVPSQTHPIPGLQTQMSPGLIPTLVGIGLILVGIGLVIQALLGRSESTASTIERTALIRVLITVLLLVAYALLFPVLGFVVTSGLFVGFFSWFFGGQSLVKIGLLAVLSPVVVWLFFEQLFRIPVPHGWLF